MKKKYLYAALILLILFTLSRLDAQSLAQGIGQIPAWSIAVLIGLQLVSQLLVNLQWHKISGFAGMAISFRDMFHINCKGAVVDAVTPGVKVGGEVTRAVQIARAANCAGQQAAAVVALQKLFSLSAFFFIGLFAVGCLIFEAPLPQARYLQGLLYGVLLLLLAGVFFLLRRRFSIAAALLEQIARLRKDTKAWVTLLLLSLLIWLIYPLKMYLLVIQISPGVSVFVIGGIAFAAYMAAMLPVFPGGLGGFEGTMSALLLTVGMTVGDALMIAVIFRFVTFWFVMLLSLAFTVFYEKKPRKGGLRRWAESLNSCQTL